MSTATEGKIPRQVRDVSRGEAAGAAAPPCLREDCPAGGLCRKWRRYRCRRASCRPHGRVIVDRCCCLRSRRLRSGHICWAIRSRLSWPGAARGRTPGAKPRRPTRGGRGRRSCRRRASRGRSDPRGRGRCLGVAPWASRCVFRCRRPPSRPPSTVRGPPEAPRAAAAARMPPSTRATPRATPRPTRARPGARRHAGGIPRDPATHEGASGSKPQLVKAHADLPSPAASDIVIGHAASDSLGLVTHASGPEAGGPTVREHQGVKPAPQPAEDDAAWRPRHRRPSRCVPRPPEVVRGPSGALVSSPGPFRSP